MSVIYVLLTISIVVAIIFFTAFIISVKSGQYDDSYTPSVRMLFEDELVKEPSSDASTNHENENKSIQLNKSQKL
jgi:cbb3-type cytochrome oxidase maturation protein